jgi:hypothetical protein
VKGVAVTKTALAAFGDEDGFGRSEYRTGRASRIQHRAELEVFGHGLIAAVSAECDIQDARALADVIRTSLDEELDLLESGLHRANGSVAKTELVARKVHMLSTINDRRINRRFGS